jgi:hypothetical protein
MTFAKSTTGGKVSDQKGYAEVSDEETPRLHIGFEFFGRDRNARISRRSDAVE